MLEEATSGSVSRRAIPDKPSWIRPRTGPAYNVPMWRCVLLLLWASATLAQTNVPSRLDFSTKTLATATLGKPYNIAIKLLGGTGPFEWQIVRGKLPPGILFQKNTATLAGTPTQTGVYKFTLSVVDQTTHATSQRDFVLEVAGPLLLEWVNPPKLTDNTISGSVKVSNSSPEGDPFDLTVFVVAVNDVGKAFALGYQHFTLSYQIEQVIPFTSTVPNGRYYVHVDAVAEVATRNLIFRSQLQTTPSLVVNVNR